MNFLRVSIYYLLITTTSHIIASTNLGTINTISNGFATINECPPANNSSTSICNTEIFKEFMDLIKFATTNNCIASNAAIRATGQTIPRCPKSNNEIRGLDNTYPTAGIFALYTGDNDTFVHDLVLNYTKKNNGIFNLILPIGRINILKKNQQLLKTLNNANVNIIEVETSPRVSRWMQDSFQFTTINNKPALYQLEHLTEIGLSFSNRFGCDIAKKCNLPYYIIPDMVDPNSMDCRSLNSGGNLEVLPGGTFYRGIVKSHTTFHNQRNDPLPYQTDYQYKQKNALLEAGNRLLELDTSFLLVGHVDEIINVVKTNGAAPCDYAIMLASPKKAFELIEAAANTRTKSDACIKNSYLNLMKDGDSKIISKHQIDKVYAANCINDKSAHEFILTDEYLSLKNTNLNSISEIMLKNEESIINELKQTTKCEKPHLIYIPVFFRGGLSYTPDLINGVVQTPINAPSNVILPRSYFNSFDEYAAEELKKIGVSTTFVHDMGYHLNQGEVHCGTNDVRICDP